MLLGDRRLFKPKRLAWLTVITSQLQKLYCVFYLYRIQVLDELECTGQVVYLERYLNDIWDFYNRAIVVENAPAYIRLFLTSSPENTPVFIGADSESYTYVGGNADEVRPYDFKIKVPSYLDEVMMFGTADCVIASANRFKQAGKRIEIEII